MKSFQYEAMKLAAIVQKVREELNHADQCIASLDTRNEHVNEAMKLLDGAIEQIVLAGEATELWPEGDLAHEADNEDVAYARVGSFVFTRDSRQKTGLVIDMSEDYAFVEWHGGGTERVEWENLSAAKVRPLLVRDTEGRAA